MWSAIGLATARQLRLSGAPSARNVVHLVLRLASKQTGTVPVGSIISLRRGFAATTAASKTKATKPSASTAGKKKPAKKPAPKKKKKPAAKKKPVPKKKKKIVKVLTDEEKLKLRIKELKKTALLKEQPTLLPASKWMVFNARETRGTTTTRQEFGDLRKSLAEQFKNLSISEQNVSGGMECIPSTIRANEKTAP